MFGWSNFYEEHVTDEYGELRFIINESSEWFDLIVSNIHRKPLGKIKCSWRYVKNIGWLYVTKFVKELTIYINDGEFCMIHRQWNNDYKFSNEWTYKSNWFGLWKRYQILGNNENKIFEFSRHNFKNTHTLEIKDSQNALVSLLIALAIDMDESRNEPSSRTTNSIHLNDRSNYF